MRPNHEAGQRDRQHRQRPGHHHRRPPQGAYASSKAGVIGLTRDLAQQWGHRKGIRVNAIARLFASEMTDAYPPGYLEAQNTRIVLQRTGDPEELAATAIWLASPAAGYVVGQTIPVTAASPSADPDNFRDAGVPRWNSASRNAM